jgi:hypothetical protein
LRLRVPQHNGSCENAVRELKELLANEAAVHDACRALNEGRKRQKLGWKTSAEIDKESRVKYNDEDRTNFYEKTKAAGIVGRCYSQWDQVFVSMLAVQDPISRNKLGRLLAAHQALRSRDQSTGKQH